MTLLAEKLTKAGVFAPSAELEETYRSNWAKGFEIAKLHADVFNTEPGRRLLEHWIRAFLTQPIVRPNEDPRADGVREGRADVVRQLLMQIEFAHKGTPGASP